MSHELLKALAALNLHRNGEVFWMSFDAEITDEELGIDVIDLTVDTDKELVLASAA